MCFKSGCDVPRRLSRVHTKDCERGMDAMFQRERKRH